MTTTIPTTNGNGRAPLAHGQRSNQGQPNVLQMIRDADAADRAKAAQADSPAKHAALNPQTSCQATSAFGPLATRKLVHLLAC